MARVKYKKGDIVRLKKLPGMPANLRKSYEGQVVKLDFRLERRWHVHVVNPINLIWVRASEVELVNL